MQSRVLIATHKAYIFPQLDLYRPIQVGAAINSEQLNIVTDNSAENISQKNRSYSELTALYWAWKNNYFEGCGYCGLVHYRRYFSGTEPFGKFKILNEDDIEKIMSAYDVIVPVKRNYYIETIRSHYEHAHYKKDLDILEDVLKEVSPETMYAFATVMKQKRLSLYNMFVMNTAYFNDYCTWLFKILFEVEKRVDISEYDAYQGRIFGFLAERLFNVWLLHHQLKVKEVKVVNLEGENLIVKAVNLLKRKYLK